MKRLVGPRETPQAVSLPLSFLEGNVRVNESRHDVCYIIDD